MILNPTPLEACDSPNQVALTIAQLLQFNVAVKTVHSDAIRHTKAREPSLPVYIGLSTHASTRQKFLVDNLHTLVLSISYARVLESSTGVAHQAINLFEQEQCVCLPKL
jgi:hypothetical protein